MVVQTYEDFRKNIIQVRDFVVSIRNVCRGQRVDKIDQSFLIYELSLFISEKLQFVSGSYEFPLTTVFMFIQVIKEN